ncbi:hypothetical protein J2R76_005799 [Bradyrhizobium sp. USDA 4532]|uniref:hypothetical protein n=1 Tax=unclassified Bradyrhizobium TaxID=2631580 RepID=UPI00209F3E9C|nr:MULTISPECIES: hypothetical protein [unclassified Bradyrhizobium]MCP1829099.1 hypothetical protein [Bradyrhizobium sp. USDA 4545]MCP1922208.1 hypothetical protein [Bradyrhizobium sp. USDA 4532]
MPKKTKLSKASEHRLTANIVSSKFSYFIADHRPSGVSFVDDEAIIDLETTIEEIEPANPDHNGATLECSLICAKRYNIDPPSVVGHPSLFSVTLKKNRRSVLAYLPSEAFWALQARLDAGKVIQLELTYIAPSRGVGDLTSIHVR